MRSAAPWDSPYICGDSPDDRMKFACIRSTICAVRGSGFWLMVPIPSAPVTRFMTPSRPSCHMPSTSCGCCPVRLPSTYMSGKIAFSWAMTSRAISRFCQFRFSISRLRRLPIEWSVTPCGVYARQTPALFCTGSDSGIHGPWNWV